MQNNQKVRGKELSMATVCLVSGFYLDIISDLSAKL